MVKKIVVVGACILALMLVVKDGRVLRTTGLTGSCSLAQTYSDDSILVGCRAGKLDGRPDLSRRACTTFKTTPTLQYWHCAAGFDLSYAGR